MTVAQRFAAVREQIAHAQERSPYGQSVTLLAATKTVDAQTINAAARECGLTHIGENRVQELLAKYEALDKTRLHIHFIGALQTNKVKYIIDKVEMIHSVDRLSLAAEIDRQAKKIGRVMPILVEVNSAQEESKSGVLPADVPEFLEKLRAFSNLAVKGIMTLGKKTQKKEEKCEFFTKTYQIFIDGAQKKLYNIDEAVLSMGMSDSYPEAIECGATLVRVGAALFGARAYAQNEQKEE